jgi:hypothetical protein
MQQAHVAGAAVATAGQRFHRRVSLAVVVLLTALLACTEATDPEDGASRGGGSPGGVLEDARTAPLPEVDAKRVALGRATYRTSFSVDGSLIETTTQRELIETTDRGEALIRIRETAGAVPEVTTYVIDLSADSLQPRSLLATHSMFSAEIVYGRRHVTGHLRTGERRRPVDIELEAPAFGDGAALQTAILGQSLADGYRASLRSIDAGLRQRVRLWSLAVSAVEVVDVPAGKFEAFRVELEPLDEIGGGQTLWMSRDVPRCLVRVENRLPPDLGGNITTTVLVAMSNRPKAEPLP